MSGTSNAAQADYWNSQPGRNWVTYQADMDLLLAGATDLLLDAAKLRQGEHVLDIGCGAGASTLAIAAAVAPDGGVLGVDISTPLVERARARCTELALGNADFLVADAQDHSFEPDRYDLIVSRLGVMFFADSVAAFRNLLGALRPGGRVLFACWAGAEHNPWFSIPNRATAQRLGPAAPTPADAPGPLAFADDERVIGMLEQAGFAAANCSAHDIGLRHPGGLSAMLRIVPYMGPIARRLREANGTDADRDAIIEAIAAGFERFDGADGIRVPARILVYSARRA